MSRYHTPHQIQGDFTVCTTKAPLTCPRHFADALLLTGPYARSQLWSDRERSLLAVLLTRTADTTLRAAHTRHLLRTRGHRILGGLHIVRDQALDLVVGELLRRAEVPLAVIRVRLLAAHRDGRWPQWRLAVLLEACGSDPNVRSECS